MALPSCWPVDGRFLLDKPFGSLQAEPSASEPSKRGAASGANDGPLEQYGVANLAWRSAVVADGGATAAGGAAFRVVEHPDGWTECGGA